MAVGRIWLLHAPTGSVDGGDQMQVAFGLDPSFDLSAPEVESDNTSRVPKGSLFIRDRIYQPFTPRSVPRGGRWFKT